MTEQTQPKKCEMNTEPESVFDHSTPKKTISCKEYRKQYRKCPAFPLGSVRECDITIIGKRGRIQTVSYSEYVERMK